jgi:hypothetical protein
MVSKTVMLKPLSIYALSAGRMALVLLSIAMSLTSRAQQAPERKMSVKGIIHTTDNKPYPYISLTLLKSADSSIVKGTITNESGEFLLSAIPPGNYLLAATELQDRKMLVKIDLTNLPSNDSLADLGIIRADRTFKSLEEIIVRGRKPLLVRKLDRLVFDVANSVLSSGNNMLEVLSRMPGVKVDPFGNVSVNGKGDVLLLVDGKGQYMGKEQAQALLNSMRSENVEKIEVITNPPARYDAQGGAVINVITRREKIKSDIHTSYGNQLRPAEGVNGFNYHFFNLGTNLNYAFNKLKTFLAVDYITNTEYRAGSTETLYLFNQGLVRQNREETEYKETGLNYRAGLNYDLSKRVSFDLEFNSFGTPRRRYMPTNSTRYSSLNMPEDADSTYSLSGINSVDGNRYTSAVGKFSFKLDSLGKNLFVFLDYSQFTNPGDQSYLGIYSYKGSPLTKSDDFRFNRKYKVHIYSFKVDYEQPLPKDFFLEAGIKVADISNRDRSNLYFETVNGSGPHITQENYRFEYDELVSGAYVSLRRSIKKFSFQAGLRGEYTRSEGRAFDPDGKLERDYFNLFPSFFTQYSHTESSQFGLSYSRRIVRPNYVDFNPNKTYYSPLGNTEGNIALQPQFQNSLELSYNTKGYYFALGFNNAQSPRIDLPREAQNDGTNIERYVTNLGRQNTFTFTAGLPVSIAKWWQTYTSLGATHARFNMLGNQRSNRWWYEIYSNHNFILNSRNRLELNFNYSSPSWYAYSKTLGLANLSVGYRCNLVKDKLDLGVNVNDVLGINKYRIIDDYGYQRIETSAFRNNRFYRISLNYRFNTGDLFSIRGTGSKGDFGEKRY